MKDEERLTLKGCTECIANGWKDCDICSMGNNPPVIEKLTAYEDTGLSPEEIEALQIESARPTEQLKNAVEKRCKAGDAIYFVNKSCDEDCNEKYVIDEGYVLAISQDKEDLEKGIWWFRGIYNSGLTYWHTDREIGAEVYFDLSAAEARLAELGGKKE